MWQINMLEASAANIPASPLAGLEVFPNPARDRTNVTYALSESDEVAVTLSDQTGRLITRTPFSQETEGRHRTILDLGSIPSGVYVLSLVSRKYGILRRERIAVSGQ